MSRVCVASLLVLAACRADIPDAVYVCDATSDCPPGLGCDTTRGLCVRDLPDAGCTPLSCETLHAECGEVDDGCGGTLECGTCTAPETCGGGGLPNVCECMPRGCEPGDCDPLDNGCGFLVDCGACDAPFSCGVVEANRCDCKTDDPCAFAKACGFVVDECGQMVDCGPCPTGETCGAEGPNACGVGACTPAPCPGAYECGSVADGCGGLVDCGSCTLPETCGGGPTGGTPHQCGCTPRTCATSASIQCGTGVEECGTTIDCGDCPGAYQECQSNRCICVALKEPNDTDAAATHIMVSSAREVFTDNNFHAGRDVDFFTFEQSMTVLDRNVLIQVSVARTTLTAASVGIWASCGSTSTDNPPICGPGSMTDSSYLDGGCIASPRTLEDTVATMSVDCPNPTVLVRTAPAAGTACAPYQMTIEITP